MHLAGRCQGKVPTYHRQAVLPLSLQRLSSGSIAPAFGLSPSRQRQASHSASCAAACLRSALSPSACPSLSCDCRASSASSSGIHCSSTACRRGSGRERVRGWPCRAASTERADATAEPAGNKEQHTGDVQPPTYAAYPDMEMPTFVDLNLTWGIPDVIEFNEGEGGAPRVWMTHPNSGMHLEVYLHGATITQWLKPDGTDALFFDEDNAFAGDSAIRGGVNLAFPQYRAGQLPENGFASRLPWKVVGAGIENMSLYNQIDAFEEGTEAPDGMYWNIPGGPDDEEDAGEAADAELTDKQGGDNDSSDAVSNSSGSSAASSSGSGNSSSAAAGDDAVGSSRRSSLESEGQALVSAESEQEQANKLDLDDDQLALMQRRQSRSNIAPSAEDALLEAVEELSEQAQQRQILDDSVQKATDDVLQALDDSIAAGNVGQMDVEGDIAPFIVLQLTDCEATRNAGWPHKFSLLYKITLMETDDFPNLKPGSELPAFGPTETPRPAEEDEESAAVEMHESEEGEVRDVGQIMEEGDEDVDGDDPPLQIKLELMLRNCDPEGSAPMRFHMAAVARFLTLDILRRSDFIKILGLGAQQVFDYSSDARFPQLGTVNDDFIHYRGDRIDTTFINSSESTILFCPGERTHFQLINRSGFKDVIVHHPGLDTKSDPDDPHRFMAGLGAGHVATLKKLQPQEEWNAEYVIRYHNKYWVSPIFGEGMQPMPALNVDRWRGDEEAMEALEASDAPSEADDADLGGTDDGPDK